MSPTQTVDRAGYHAALAAAMSEAELQGEHVMPLAKANGWRIMHARKVQAADGRWYTAIAGDTGYVDLTLARGGRVLHIELKTETGTLDAEQRKWRDAIGPTTWRLWRPRHWFDGTIERELK